MHPQNGRGMPDPTRRCEDCRTSTYFCIIISQLVLLAVPGIGAVALPLA